MKDIRLEITLTLAGPILTAASTPGEPGIDAPVARRAGGRCYLPFSLVKGRIRQSWEELALGGINEWFGALPHDWQSHRGKLRFSDFVHDPERSRTARTDEALRAGARTAKSSRSSKQQTHRIQIDEATGAANEGALQVIESPFGPGEPVVFTGALTFFDADPESAKNRIEKAFRWTTSFGAGRTVGFGRLLDVDIAMSVRETSAVPLRSRAASDGALDLVIRFSEPFCVSKRRVADNLFESETILSGAVLRGALAAALNRVLGRLPEATIDSNATSDSQWSALAAHFNAIHYTGAFPAPVGARRPVAIPLSSVRDGAGAVWDAALCPGPGLIDGRAPTFTIDWKDDRDVQKRFGWERPGRELRVRTAIDRHKRRAEDQKLYAYDMVEPTGFEWLARVDFSGIDASVRNVVSEQFQRLVQLGVAEIGKSKARPALELRADVWQPQMPSRLRPIEANGEKLWVITLQTPALLCDPATLSESSGEQELFDSYAAAWSDISTQQIQLVRYFASQSLAGGYLVNRFQHGRPYNAFLLTNPGSVFVLKEVQPADERISTWQRNGLDLPKWAIDRYTTSWSQNPFLPADGFGEVAVNLDWHRNMPPKFVPISSYVPLQARPIDHPRPVGHAKTPSPAIDTAPPPPPFENRVRIDGELVTKSPFHLGDGGAAPPRESLKGKRGKPVEISSISADWLGRPSIPGSSIKGALRSWLVRNHADESLIRSVFGNEAPSPDVVAKELLGGKAEFWDSVAEQWTEGLEPPISASVAINRWTRAAEHRKLIHREVVPAGTSFKVIVTGQNLSGDEVELLRRALHGLGSGAGDATLGAETQNGWGRFAWHETAVRRIEDGSTHWSVGYENLPDVRLPGITVQSPRRTIPFTIELQGPFLVNNPELAKEREREKEEGQYDHTPLVDGEGKPILPVSSFRGAFRAQAERIARTVGGRSCHSTDPREACRFELRGSGADAVRDAVQRLCLTCRVFGTTGWASRIGFDPFQCDDPGTKRSQELVAIDRFTGGVSGGAKFDVEWFWQPRFSGAVDVERLREIPGALGLVMLTLRDLAEGDITLGFGASKGFGGCRATGIDWSLFSIGENLDPVGEFLHAIGQIRGSARLPQPDSTTPAPTTALLLAAGPDHFFNPYHFVPAKCGPRESDLPVGRFDARQLGHVTHDRYVPETFSGRIVCRMETVTPLVIGDKRSSGEGGYNVVKPFTLPGSEEPAIPATSLRGVVSSVAEAASNSALRVLHDQKYSVRCTMKESLQAIGMIKGRKLIPLALPALKKEGNGFPIPRKYLQMFSQRPRLKVFVDGYRTSGANPPELAIRNDSFLRAAHYPKSYSPDNREEFWYAQMPSITFDPATGNVVCANPREKKEYLLGAIAQAPKSLDDIDPRERDSFTRGILRVLDIKDRETEIPTTKKHEMFIPFSDEDLDGPAFDADQAIHEFESMAGERTDSQKNELKDLHGLQRTHKALPYSVKGSKRNDDGTDRLTLRDGDLVFFEPTEDGSRVARLSVASIWRKRVPGGAHDFFARLSPELLPFNPTRRQITIGEQLFGFVESSERDGRDTPARALAGRVRFSFGRFAGRSVTNGTLQPDDAPFLGEKKLKILSSPKPPSPSMYFRPSRGEGYVARGSTNAQEHLPHGRKFYLHHERPDYETRHEDELQNQKALVNPIGPERAFFFHVDFDNLSIEEVGLLSYALRPTDRFRHKLGMGKPLGLGSVRIDPVGLFAIDRLKRYSEAWSPAAPRYHFRWLPAAAHPATWAEAYKAEKTAAAASMSGVDLPGITAGYRASIDNEIRTALEALGETFLENVHTPQLALGDNEVDTYQWFVANDDNDAEQFRQFLRPLASANGRISLAAHSQEIWRAKLTRDGTRLEASKRAKDASCEQAEFPLFRPDEREHTVKVRRGANGYTIIDIDRQRERGGRPPSATRGDGGNRETASRRPQSPPQLVDPTSSTARLHPSPPQESEFWTDPSLSYDRQAKLITATRPDGATAQQRAEPDDPRVVQIESGATVRRILVRSTPNKSLLIMRIEFA